MKKKKKKKKRKMSVRTFLPRALQLGAGEANNYFSKTVVLLYLCMHRIGCALGRRSHILVWRESGAFCVKHLVIPPFAPPSTSCCLSVWQVPIFSGAWRLTAGMSGFASHGCSVHLGAGSQYWMLQDVSGTNSHQ